MRRALVLGCFALVAACGSAAPPLGTTTSSPPLAVDEPSAPASREGARRDALVTLATLQFAAALEATDDDRRRDRDHGNFEAALRPDAPLRADVLEHVRGWSPDDRRRALAFFRAHPAFSTLYHALAVESFGPPPSFTARDHGPATVRNAPDLFAARGDLGELLAWAYGPGRAGELSRALAPRWDAMQLPAADVEAKKRAVLAYLTYPVNEPLPSYDVVYDPLLRELNGYGSNPNEGEMLLIVGFTKEQAEREMLLIHEFTHLPLERLITSKPVMPSLERAACADAKIGDHKGYDGFANHVNETLVRAISYRIAGVQRDTGFVFEPFFAAQLATYEALPERDFMTWAPRLFEALAAEYCR